LFEGAIIEMFLMSIAFGIGATCFTMNSEKTNEKGDYVLVIDGAV
jgi:hypothetical protein